MNLNWRNRGFEEDLAWLIGKGIPNRSVDRDLLVLGASLVDQFVHSLVEAGLVARFAIAAHVQDAVSFEAKALQCIGQIADFGIATSLGLAESTDSSHTGIIGTDWCELRNDVRRRQLPVISSYAARCIPKTSLQYATLSPILVRSASSFADSYLENASAPGPVDPQADLQENRPQHGFCSDGCTSGIEYAKEYPNTCPASGTHTDRQS